MISTATVGAIRAIGRPVDRQAVGPLCPTRVAYFGWGGSVPGTVTQAVRNAQAPGPCCPPSLPQRNALQAGHYALHICCAGTSWAVLPSTDPKLVGEANRWLASVEPHAASTCTSTVVAGVQLPDDVNRLARMNQGQGPQNIQRAGVGRGGFTRAPVRWGGREGLCPSMCLIGGVDVVKWNKCGVPDPPKACLAPSAPSNFAETSWCADYAATHGALGVRGCTNAAMGLGELSGKVTPPPKSYPICNIGKDCAG